MAPKARPVSTKEVLSSTGDRLAGWKSDQERVGYLWCQGRCGGAPLPSGVRREAHHRVAENRAKIKLKENYKLKARLVVCGNWQIWQASSVENATQNIDAGALRLLLSLHSSATSSLTQLDVSAAFLNAFLDSDSLADRIMVTPPSCLVTLGVVPRNTAWLLKKALYGLRDTPKCWQIHHDKCLKELEWKVMAASGHWLKAERTQLGLLTLVALTASHVRLWIISSPCHLCTDYSRPEALDMLISCNSRITPQGPTGVGLDVWPCRCIRHGTRRVFHAASVLFWPHILSAWPGTATETGHLVPTPMSDRRDRVWLDAHGQLLPDTGHPVTSVKCTKIIKLHPLMPGQTRTGQDRPVLDT
eukprot:3546836-Amphidinium_carterae.1